MSKTALKKELKNFDSEQRLQVIMDLYERCREAREYLDFFVDPDADALYLRHRGLLEKELKRGKYGRSTARISQVRKIIRKYDSFGAGAECTVKFMQYAVLQLLLVERSRMVSNTLVNGTETLLTQMLDYGDKHGVFDVALKAAGEIVDSPHATEYMKRLLSNALRDYLENNT